MFRFTHVLHFLFFFFFLNCPVLFQYIHRFKSHSRLKNTTTTTKKEHYCRQQTVNVSGKKLVGSCVSSPVRLGEKLVTSEEKHKKKQLFFQSPRQRDGQTYKDLLWISAAGTRTQQMCEKDFKKKKKAKKHSWNVFFRPIFSPFGIHETIWFC